MGLFSSKQRRQQSASPPASRITEQDKAVLQLKQMRDKLKQYKKRIELQLEKEREAAKTLLKNGQVDKAKLLLKKKKFYERTLERTDAQLDNLDQMCHTLEFTQIEQQVVAGLKYGNDCLKKLHELMSLDDIEQIMDDTREAVEYQQRIDRLISGEFVGEKDNDELMEDLNAELEGILASALPDVPQTPIPKTNSEQEADAEATPVASQKQANKQRQATTTKTAILAD